MSKDKGKQANRIDELLVRAGELGGALALNCQGGMAADNESLRKGVFLGLFRVERDQGRPSHTGATIRRTMAVVTDSGLERLASLLASRDNKHTTMWKMWWQR